MNRLLAVGILLAYNTWVAFGLNGRPDALAGYTSELAASDQPYHWVFRCGDVVTGVLLLAVAAVGWRGWRRWLGALAPWLSVAVGTFGLATILDAFFNLPCSPSFDSACHAAEQANPYSWQFLPHTIASVTTGLVLVASLLIVLVALARGGWGPAAGTVLALGLVIGALLLATIGWQFAYNYGHGYFQIPQIILTSLWFAYLAWKVRPHA